MEANLCAANESGTRSKGRLPNTRVMGIADRMLIWCARNVPPFECGRLMWPPGGMAGEEAARETHFINDKKAEHKADDAACGGENAVHARKAGPRKRERNGDCGGDQHHSRDRAEAENEQVDHGPNGDANRRKNKERDGCGAGETVDDSYHEWTQQLVQAEAAEGAVHPSERSGGFFGCIFCCVRVCEFSVGVEVPGTFSKALPNPVDHAGKIQYAEENQHQADGELHREAEARGDDDAK